jgi:hypothetical protein
MNRLIDILFQDVDDLVIVIGLVIMTTLTIVFTFGG